MQDAVGRGHRVNVTLIFSAGAGAARREGRRDFVSPFVGRLDDIATHGMDLIREIVEIFENYEFATEVLVASVRTRSTSSKRRGWARTSARVRRR